MVVDKSNMIEAAQELVKELMKSNDPSHDWHHVERVYQNALHLAECESKNNSSIDMDVVKLAALFHDVVDFKYDHGNSKTMDEIAIERLGPFFEKFQLDQNKIDSILYIILNLSWRKELENKEPSEQANKCQIELDIVRDSDRLDAIGAVGIARCFAFSGAKYRPLHLKNVKPIENMTAEQYNKQSINNESTAVNHFYEKLLLIKDKMKTETGKKLAEQRTNFMTEYLKQFDREVALLA